VKRTAHQSRDGLCEMRLASFFPVSSVRRTWFTCLKSRFVHPVLFTVTEPRCRRLAVGEDCKCPEDTPPFGAPGRTPFSACQASSSLDSKGSMRGAMAGMACEWLGVFGRCDICRRVVTIVERGRVTLGLSSCSHHVLGGFTCASELHVNTGGNLHAPDPEDCARVTDRTDVGSQ
jgi:hypothetical protein